MAKRKPRARAASAASKAKPDDELRIAVTFRRSTDQLGLTRFGARMTAAAVHEFLPDELAVGRGIDALTRAGFRVTTRGKLSVSIRGSRRDFERVFGTKLTPQQVATPPPATMAAPPVYFPAADAPWAPDPGIAALIDDAYIQWPHLYFNQRFVPPPSPLPPRVDYHHLRVPGDVVLMVNAARVHRQGCTGHGVRVAMIDSGFAHGHPYFVEHGYNTSVVLAPGATHKDRDGNGHGTGESANLLAIAPDCTFIGVKLDSEDGSSPGASVLEGFQEALRHNPQVISVSLGYDLVDGSAQRRHLTALPNNLKALEAEIQAAVAAGVVVVFSAGNGHVAFPGMMPEVVSAGGVFVAADGAMRASDYASAFASRIYAGRAVPDLAGLVGLASNRADYIMLPIEVSCEIDVSNAAHDRTTASDGWGVFSGTSAAAPQLAGVCALLLEKNPGLTPSEIQQVLRRTARDVVQGAASAASNEGVALAAAPGADGATGGGLVDAFAAWQQV
ncbi:MAG: S8 family serine peptidase [Phycisphaerae bacterium]